MRDNCSVVIVRCNQGKIVNNLTYLVYFRSPVTSCDSFEPSRPIRPWKIWADSRVRIISQRKSRRCWLCHSLSLGLLKRIASFSRTLSSAKLQFRCILSGPTSVREPKWARERFISCKMTAKRNQTFCEQYFGGGGVKARTESKEKKIPLQWNVKIRRWFGLQGLQSRK